MDWWHLLLLLIGAAALDWWLITHLDSIAMTYGVEEAELPRFRKSAVFKLHFPLLLASVATFAGGMFVGGLGQFVVWSVALVLLIAWAAVLWAAYTKLIRSQPR